MNKIDKLYKNAKRIKIDDNSKIVIMSDCHRGTGDNYDNFVKNKNIYMAALQYYYDRDFTYIELGDGDDMWEVKNYKEIIQEYLDVFKMLKKFYDEKRFIMMYGNHDLCKKNKKILEKNFYHYYDKLDRKEKELFLNLEVWESLILEYKSYDLFLLHGHQIDILNSTLWRLARFLVRYVWRPMEHFGFRDPTSAAKNYRGKEKCQKKLQKWSKQREKILISGHTHKPCFPCPGESLYFNDGACIHPNGITCLEIENGFITLVRFIYSVTEDKLITIERKQIEKREKISRFFEKGIDEACKKND